MLNNFYPKQYVSSVFKIDYDALLLLGISNLIFDIDNTLVPFDVEKPTTEVLNLINSLIKKGFKICLLSNNKEARVAAFNISLNLPNVSRARKPSRRGIRRAFDLLNASYKDTAIIGDQVFTDVLSGNRASLYTILVKPISVKDEFSVKLKRGAEQLVIKTFEKKGIKLK